MTVPEGSETAVTSHPMPLRRRIYAYLARAPLANPALSLFHAWNLLEY